MTPELARALLAIERETDVSRLRDRARDLLKTVALMSRREGGNYAIVGRDNGRFEIGTGSKEFCIGFATARNEYTRDGADTAVMCGDFEVWPDWGGTE